MSMAVAAAGVEKRFGELHALGGVRFGIRRGEIVAIVGKSGCGKSTLLRLIAGLDVPSAGTIRVDGAVGYMPQQDWLPAWRTALENALLPKELAGAVAHDDVCAVKGMLEEVGLGGFIHAYPEELSGGMRQRVSLVRALSQDAGILLLDEPFSSIDFDARLVLVKALRDRIKCKGGTAVIVTHNIEDAIALADRILVIASSPGRITRTLRVALAERDPVRMRKEKRFQALFETIWQAMRCRA